MRHAYEMPCNHFISQQCNNENKYQLPTLPVPIKVLSLSSSVLSLSTGHPPPSRCHPMPSSLYLYLTTCCPINPSSISRYHHQINSHSSIRTPRPPPPTSAHPLLTHHPRRILHRRSYWSIHIYLEDWHFFLYLVHRGYNCWYHELNDMAEITEYCSRLYWEREQFHLTFNMKQQSYLNVLGIDNIIWQEI